MLRIVQSKNSLSASYLVDPNAIFEPGIISQLKIDNVTIEINNKKLLIKLI